MEKQQPQSASPEWAEEKLLCSELVELRWHGSSGQRGSTAANLEEIWNGGATLDAEQPIPRNAQVVLVRPPIELKAAVLYCRRNETGFAVGIRFAAGTQWSPQLFVPAHAVSPGDLEVRKPAKQGDGKKAKGAGAPSLVSAGIAARAASSVAEQGSLYCLGIFASAK